MDDGQLEGGLSNPGAVVRSGRQVLRPSGPHSMSVHAFLRAVRRTGFAGVPMPFGIDEHRREHLEFVDGDVPHSPYPAWSQSDSALASVAELLRGLHEASHGFDPRRLTWNDTLADPAGGTVICHNDLEPSNVVFRDERAVAFIDWEFAAPGRPVFDLAQLARLWVPIEDDVDQDRMGWHPADRPARLRLVADAYGLDAHGRTGLLSAMVDAIDRIEAAVRRSLQGGQQTPELLVATGGIEKYERRRRWWLHHHDEFVLALR